MYTSWNDDRNVTLGFKEWSISEPYWYLAFLSSMN
jgi:hypothetical protein